VNDRQISKRIAELELAIASGITVNATGCRIVVESAPFDGTLHCRIGEILEQQGDFETAQFALESALLLIPLSAASEVSLARCYIERDHGELAISILENVSRREGVGCDSLLKAAELFDRLDENRLAWSTARRAVQESPEDAKAWFHLSFYMGRLAIPFPHVEAAARRAIDLAPDNTEYRISLAAALSQFDRYSDAMHLVRHLIDGDLRDICCASCLRNLRSVFEMAEYWDGVVVCSDELARRNIETNANTKWSVQD